MRERGPSPVPVFLAGFVGSETVEGVKVDEMEVDVL